MTKPSSLLSYSPWRTLLQAIRREVSIWPVSVTLPPKPGKTTDSLLQGTRWKREVTRETTSIYSTFAFGFFPRLVQRSELEKPFTASSCSHLPLLHLCSACSYRPAEPYRQEICLHGSISSPEGIKRLYLRPIKLQRSNERKKGVNYGIRITKGATLAKG